MAATYTELGVASELLAIVGELGHAMPTESSPGLPPSEQTALFSVTMPFLRRSGVI